MVHVIDALYMVAAIVLFVVAIYCPDLRKTIGVLFVIIGGMLCFTVVGLCVGVPIVVVGAILWLLGLKGGKADDDSTRRG